MKYETPQLVTHSYRLMLEMERAVRNFPVAHKYDCGKEMRTLAYDCYVQTQDALRAGSNRSRQAVLVRQIIKANDSLKARLPVAFDLQLFKSKGQYSDLAEIAHGVGRQLGGWLRSVEHPNGQNSNA